jgi:predicted nucleotidyltransferase
MCAQQALNNSSVAGVELFGSLARGEEHDGSDIDIIIVTSDTCVMRWLIEMYKLLSLGDATCHMRDVRRQCAIKVLEIELSDDIDALLLPPNWRVRHEEFQQMGCPPGFMDRVAQDAIQFNQEQNIFAWLHQ